MMLTWARSYRTVNGLGVSGTCSLVGEQTQQGSGGFLGEEALYLYLQSLLLTLHGHSGPAWGSS
jgi:hypothetical protein